MPVLPRLHPVLVALCLPLAGACGDPQEAEDTSESTGSTTAPTTSSTTTPTTSTTVTGDWVPSPEFFGTDSDFVMRAIVRPL